MYIAAHIYRRDISGSDVDRKQQTYILKIWYTTRQYIRTHHVDTADLPTIDHILIATFAEDKATLALHTDPVVAVRQLQLSLDFVQEWANNWRIKINKAKLPLLNVVHLHQ